METGRQWGEESDENYSFNKTWSHELTSGRGNGVGMNRKKTLGALERALSWDGGGCVKLGESPSSGVIFLFYIRVS